MFDFIGKFVVELFVELIIKPIGCLIKFLFKMIGLIPRLIYKLIKFPFTFLKKNKNKKDL